MTSFWRPVLSEPLGQPTAQYRKQLGNRVYVLWARCDVCHASGRFETFELWERGADGGTLCMSCSARDDVRKTLIADGWWVVG